MGHRDTILQLKLFLIFIKCIEELEIFGDDNEVSFNGMQMVSLATLPLAGVDFSFCVHIKTNRAGNIVSNLPEDRRWTNESKALFVDAAGIVKFVSSENILCESSSRVDDDSWHEIAVVYSYEDNRYGFAMRFRIV